MGTFESRNAAFYGLFEGVQRYAASYLSAVQKIRKTRRSRAVTRHLLTYDDRMLNDMGVSRSDVERALAGDWDTDPAVRLAEIRRRRMQAERQGLVQGRAK